MVYNKLNDSGVFVSKTKMRGQSIIRFAPGSPLTKDYHIDQFHDLLLRTAHEAIAIKKELKRVYVEEKEETPKIVKKARKSLKAKEDAV
jgi:hypothetical protein